MWTKRKMLCNRWNCYIRNNCRENFHLVIIRKSMGWKESECTKQVVWGFIFSSTPKTVTTSISKRIIAMTSWSNADRHVAILLSLSVRPCLYFILYADLDVWTKQFTVNLLLSRGANFFLTGAVLFP